MRRIGFWWILLKKMIVPFNLEKIENAGNDNVESIVVHSRPVWART
jgi:hypothetical protein